MTSKLTRERLLDISSGRANSINDIPVPTIAEVQQMASQLLAAMDSEPVEKNLRIADALEGLLWPNMALGNKAVIQAAIEALRTYHHAQQPVVPEEIKHRIGGLDWGWEGEFNRGWNACRAAMLQAKSLTSINPAPAMVSLPKNSKSLAGNSPVIGIDPASGPDRTVEVRYVSPPGYVMVPKEPTREILDEFDSIIDYGAEDSVDAWRRLLAAAPQELK